MKVVALISGGKDSSYNMMQCIAAGHEIVALANITPYNKTELDSYMYQSVGFEAIEFISAAMDLPLYREQTRGVTTQQGKTYSPINDGDEVEDLFKVLSQVKDDLGVDAVSVGAILSDYQRVRVENVCVRLGLVPLAYLWQREQKELLDEMIKCEIDAVVIKVAALGLDPTKHLGRSLSSLQSHLLAMGEKYGLNVCGEGGEYETLTLDCPLFKSRLVIDESEMVLHSNDHIAPVGFLRLKKLSLENKLPHLNLEARLSGLPLKDSDGYVTDYGVDACEFSDDDSPPPTNTNPNLETINQNPSAVKSSDGWLWVGGIQGRASTFREAMEDATGNLKSILSQHGHTVRDVCSLVMFVSDMGHYDQLNRVYCETFRHVDPPTRACVEVASGCPVILAALSWTPTASNSGDSPIERHTMHVQSRSHWAPANIGPYSQAVRIGELINIAGQIGLVPGSLEMVKGGIESQCQLALRHVGRLLKAMDSNVNLRDVVQGICYVTDLSFVENARKLWEENTNNAIVDYVVVSRLPRNALVEWHVWAHRHNNQFEYEETGKCLDGYSISIYRRWNYENDIAAIVCYLDNAERMELTEDIFRETVDYAVQKLSQGYENESTSIYNLTIFYGRPIRRVNYLQQLAEKISLTYTFVPVTAVKSANTYFSICGVRYQ